MSQEVSSLGWFQSLFRELSGRALDKWTIPGEHRWRILGEHGWRILGEHPWRISGEHRWHIYVRLLTPGAGKSTVTEFLAMGLATQGVPVRCLIEDDAAHLDAFAPVRESFRTGVPDAVDALLASSGNLVQESADVPSVHLVDALLPGYHFLFGLYPASRIASYNTDLHKVLCSMQPMIVYLRSDVDSAFRRAVEERGEEWLGEFLKRVNGHYRRAQNLRTSLPLSSTEDVVSFFEEMDRLMLRMVRGWAGKSQIVETRGRTVDEVKMTLSPSVLVGEAAQPLTGGDAAAPR